MDNTCKFEEVCYEGEWRNPPVATNPASCDLQDVIVYYRSQPELLRLILLSKVEEDKRRTEEARLRAKQLDLLLLQHQEHPSFPLSDGSGESSMPPSFFDNEQQQPQARHQMDSMTYPDSAYRRNSLLGSTSFGSSNSSTGVDDPDDAHSFSPVTSETHFPQTSTSYGYFADYNHNNNHPMNNTISHSEPISPPYYQEEPPTIDTLPLEKSTLAQRPRRRREMQAITQIVETREFPYNDGHFWKNNGNTIQKKTGNKSVYYKCSNSSKGCPVNKTVIWKDNGEYLIKYRGEHLPDCGKVQRIVDI